MTWGWLVTWALSLIVTAWWFYWFGRWVAVEEELARLRKRLKEQE